MDEIVEYLDKALVAVIQERGETKRIGSEKTWVESVNIQLIGT